MDLEGFRLCIVHHGENLPNRSGYVPLRYGRLAEDLTDRGATVVRVSPAFNHLHRDWNAECGRSSEGEHVLIDTPEYGASFSISRADFLRRFVTGSGRYLSERDGQFDAVLVGVPPPGMVRRVSRSVSSDVAVLADIRDIWPQALAVGKLRALHGVASIGGFLLSQEMRVADAVTAVTPAMAAWAPKSVQVKMLPLGMDDRPDVPSRRPEQGAAISACFLSSHIHGYDFVPLLKGWSEYTSTLGNAEPRLAIVGPSSVPEELTTEAARLGVKLEVTGRVPANEVHSLLNEFDVGIAPATKEWGHSLGNKIFDYLSAGLYVLHTLDPATGAVIDDIDCGTRVDGSVAGWSKAFVALNSEKEEFRASRSERIERSVRVFGRNATTNQFLELLRP